VSKSITSNQKRHLPPALVSIGAPVLGCLIGLIIGALLILLANADPIGAYKTMLKGAFGGERQITETLLKAGPLLLIALGLTTAFRAKIWNIGAEGQYYMGALFGGLVALFLTDLPRAILIPFMLLAAVAGGMFWAYVAAFLKVKMGMNVIISTLMLNYIAILLMEYLARGPLQEPGGYLPVSAQFDKVTKLPLLFGTRVHLGVLIAVLLVPIIYTLLWSTPLGFRVRAVGSRASVARYAGINVEKIIVFVLVLSGGFAGLAGIIEVATLHTRLKSGISQGYGFSAILVALLGRMNPIGVTAAALFFAALIIGSEAMHVVYGLPVSLADAIQAIIVLSVLAVDAIARRRMDS
jgi:general nucleoside transport system permease protein